MKSVLSLIFICFLAICGSSQTVTTTLVYETHPPKTKSAKTPVLILLHGYGSNEADLMSMARLLDDKLFIFSLRAPLPTKNGGYCWYPLDFLPGGELLYDYAQVQQSRAKVFAFISNACKAYQLDSTQVFLMGFSQGAIMSYDIALKAPSKIKGVLALSGRLMEESRQMKTDWSQAGKVKFFIGHGTKDNVIHPDEAAKANQFLISNKVKDITYKTYAVPHTITGPELEDLRDWLSKNTAAH